MYAVLVNSTTLYVLPFPNLESIQLFLGSGWFKHEDRFETPHLLLTSETRIDEHRIDYKKSMSGQQVWVASGWKKWLHRSVHYDLSTSQIEYWKVALEHVKSGTHRLQFTNEDKRLTDDIHQERTRKWLEIESQYIAQQAAKREIKLAVLEEALLFAGAYGVGREYIQNDLARLRRRYTKQRTEEAMACYSRLDFVPVQYRGGHKS
jgi:hypothetical protein